MVVVRQDRLRLEVVPFEPCPRPRVERRQWTVGSGVAVAVEPVGVDRVEEVEVMGNPAGWLLNWMEDMMTGKCLAWKEIVEGRGHRSRFVPLPLQKKVSRMINASDEPAHLGDRNDILRHNPLHET